MSQHSREGIFEVWCYTGEKPVNIKNDSLYLLCLCMCALTCKYIRMCVYMFKLVHAQKPVEGARFLRTEVVGHPACYMSCGIPI